MTQRSTHRPATSFGWVSTLIIACLCACSTPTPPETAHTTPNPPKPRTVAAPKPPPPPPNPAPRIEASKIFHSAVTPAAEKANTPPPFPKKKRILMVGDSMAWAVGVYLEKLLEPDGHTFILKSTISESIRSFSGRTFKKQLRTYKPDIVLVVLGSNDYMVAKPEERLLKHITRVVGHVTQKPCYWIGPPMWTKDTGVVRLLEEHSAPCAFFNSSPLELKRRSDKIHPNREGAQAWAQAVYTWLQETPYVGAWPPKPKPPASPEPKPTTPPTQPTPKTP